MTHAVTLLLGVHAHQPVGNFPEVIEDAHQRCYKPAMTHEESMALITEGRGTHFDPYLVDVFQARNYIVLLAFFNSAVITFSAVTLLVIFAAMVGYVLQRRKLKYIFKVSFQT